MTDAEKEQTIRRIGELAATVIEQFGPLSEIEFGFNRASVEWVEGFVGRWRARSDPANPVSEGLVNAFGSFLGECILSATAGKWDWSEQQKAWGILFPSGAWAFPFAKVWKLFENGIEGGDSIVSFYNVAVNFVAPGKLP